MITVPSVVQNKLKQANNIEIGIGATMDINCNTLISFDKDADFSGANYYVKDGRQPFTLLFPLEHVVRPFRPEKCGIKYAIEGDVSTNSYHNPRNVEYKTVTDVTYRTYCPSVNTFYKYYLTQINTNADFTITYFNNANPISSSNKSVLANKVVLKFELAHSTPTSWSIFINGVDVTSSLSKTIPSTGILTIYYTGSAWSLNESALNYSSQVTINTLRVTATNPGGDKYIGIIEVAPHIVRDLTDRLVSFDIQKEASSKSKDILPVGLATANSLQMNLNSYGNSNILFRNYNPDEAVALNSSYMYMVKQAEIKPYYKIYDSAGTATDSKGAYFLIPQGSFYLDSWQTSEFGDLTLFALDGAKILQETICPDILCNEYSSTAILRRILDSIGFTNYEFKLLKNQATGQIIDKSIMFLNYWWSDGTKTAWEAIQEICSDMQMSAFFDENNVLQFYSRDYVFNQSSVSWVFRNTTNGNELPNIVSLSSEIYPSSNNIKVLYNSAFVATYEQSNKSLADVDKTALSSAILLSELNQSTTTGGYVNLEVISDVMGSTDAIEIFQSYSGYFLLNDEIIEYDGIEYEYLPRGGGSRVPVVITGPSDLTKYRGLAQTTADSKIIFIPTKRYRIKKRGAFGTRVKTHPATINQLPPGWSTYVNMQLSSNTISTSNLEFKDQDSNDYNESSGLKYVDELGSTPMLRPV